MATLYITELAEVQMGVLPVEPPVAAQTMTPAGTASSSSAFNNQTQFVRILSDTACCIRFGTAPTAVTTDERIAANVEYIRQVPYNKAFKLSIIT